MVSMLFKKTEYVLCTGTLESISASWVKGFTSKIVAKQFQVQDTPRQHPPTKKKTEGEKSRL
jgi:hypothetical protein